jgi:hypothetical protein
MSTITKSLLPTDRATNAARRVASAPFVRAVGSASPEHTVKALRVVEELRAAVLGNQDKLRDGV